MKTLLTFSILIVFIFSAQAQNVITVDNNINSGAQFTSVQGAIDAASSGDIILIHPSPDGYGNCTIDKTLHLRGLAHYPDLNSGERAFLYTINFNSLAGAEGSSISGLEFYNATITPGGSYDNISFTNNKITGWISNGNDNQTNNWLFQGNYIVLNTFNGISKQNANNWMIVNNYILNLANAESWNLFTYFNSSDVIRNNIIGTQQTGANNVIFAISTNIQLENCILINAGGTGYDFSNQTWTNCLSYSYSSVEFNSMPGSNNLDNTDPGFEIDGDNMLFSYTDDYHLSSDSPAYEYGTDGESLGIYGNGFEFSQRGYPRDLPYPVNMGISSTVVNVGEEIEVQIEARGN